MDAHRFRMLSAHQQALVAMAVLLDGHEASIVLSNDAIHGENLERVAISLATLQPDLRMPYVGSLLRSALENIEETSSKG